jgi:hypothetical protein
MSRHLTPETLRKHDERALTPMELLEVDRHLSRCEECRGLLAAQIGLRGAEAAFVSRLQKQLCTVSAEDEHLTSEESFDFLEGTVSASDREKIKAHLDGCPRCTLELEELRSFRALMSTYPVEEHRPEAEKTPSRGRWQPRGFVLDPLPLLLRGATGVALVAVGAALVYLPLTARFSAELARARSSVSPRPLPPIGDDTRLAAALQAREQELRQLRARSAAEMAKAREEGRKKGIEEQRRIASGATAGTSAPPWSISHDPILHGRPVAPPDGSSRTASSGSTPLTPQNVARARVELVVPGPGGELTVARPVQMAKLDLPTDPTRGGSSRPESAPRPGAAVRLLGPAETRVRSAPPDLTWDASPTARFAYHAFLFRLRGDRWEQVERSEEQTETHWAPKTPLEPGAAYRWEVIPYLDGKALADEAPPGGLFRVLTMAEDRQLQAAAAAAPKTPLARATLYLRFGLRWDARRQLEQHLRAAPRDEVARKLLELVHSGEQGQGGQP